MTDGQLWSEQRRFTVRHLKDLGFGKTSLEGLMLQEVSDLMTVPGIDIIGTLPAEIGEVMTFSAAIFAEAAQPEAVRAFMAFLTEGADRELLRAKGLEPV